MVARNLVDGVGGGYGASADNNLANPFDALYVGAAGTLTVVKPDGGTAVFVGATAGSTIPVTGVRVTGAQTAAQVVALYEV